MSIQFEPTHPTIGQVVLGFDFSKQATQALELSLDIARRHACPLDVVVAVPGHLDGRVASADVDPMEKVADPSGEAVRHVEARIGKVLAELPHEGVQLRYHIRWAKPVHEILAEARKDPSSLVVVGATGLGAWGQVFIGSTSRRLVHESPAPVVVVREESRWPPRTIVCPVDFSRPSLVALEWAAMLGKGLGARVIALHVVETVPRLWLEVSGVMYEESFQAAEDREFGVRVSQLAEICASPTMAAAKVEPRVVSGQPEQCILDEARAVEADLVCMGSVGRSGVEGIFVGNTAERLLRVLRCSLLTVKAPSLPTAG